MGRKRMRAPKPVTRPNPTYVHFSVGISADFDKDFRGWQSNQIKAFMLGVAEVTAASRVERAVINGNRVVPDRTAEE